MLQLPVFGSCDHSGDMAFIESERHVSSTFCVPPVQLQGFNAVAKRGQVILTWVTFTEVHNAFFTIERSTDGVEFETLEQIQGAGNSAFSIEYQAVDTKPIVGLSYYRLKQTDVDGRMEYFDVIPVRFQHSKLEILQVAFSKNKMSIEVYDPSGNGYRVQLLNSSGQLVAQGVSAELPLPTAHGLYILRVSNGADTVVQKIVVSK